jgi:PST family polysaccharide transporter
LGGIFGTVGAIGIVYYFYSRGEAERGVAPSMVCVAGMTLLASWWFGRRVKVDRVAMRWCDYRTEVAGLLNLGVVFMLATFMALGAAFLIRAIILRELGEDAAGYYQSAWAIGGMYVGFVLQAMGTDFYPRLTAVAKDHAECNRLVNEQAEVGLLIAGPGVLGALTFTPLIIQIFYSTKFGPAVEVLRWICLGMIMRVASWPMGFILGAKGYRRGIFFTELVANGSQFAFAWLGVRWLGLDGAGIGFFAGYVLYWFVIYFTVRSVTGFRWSAENKRVGLALFISVSALFVGWYFLERPVVVAAGALITLMAGYLSLKTLCSLVSLDRLPKVLRRLAAMLRLTPNPIS